jgi:FMN phosphatase YigB (HAD superfamily)
MVSSRSPIKRYVFDLDGTLFDTEHRVRQAYLDAGVDMPDDAWGKPAVAWLPALKGSHWKQYHQRKTELYLRSLRAIPPRRTSAASAMIELALSGVETHGSIT